MPLAGAADMPKHSLRQRMLALRKGHSSDDLARASVSIQRQLASQPIFVTAATVAFYMPVHGEVDTVWLMEKALAAGKRVVLPAVDGGRLTFRQIAGLASLVPGSFGIPEPLPICPECQPADADILIVPGVAFDLAGRRIGYGKGYYDRALHQLEGSGRLIALSFDFQLLDEIVGEPHDVLMDLIITETRVVTPVSVTIQKGVQQ